MKEENDTAQCDNNVNNNSNTLEPDNNHVNLTGKVDNVREDVVEKMRRRKENSKIVDTNEM